MSILEKLIQLESEAVSKAESASGLEALDQIRIQYLGKKGSLSEVLKGLGSASPEERPKIGAAANLAKAKVEAALEAKKVKLEGLALEQRLATEQIDTTVLARQAHLGALHPITQTTQKLIKVFSRLGFDVVTGPEVETEFLNFEAVNIPADHPARDMQDTFFLGPGVVLRTHTSAVQMRAMRSKSWPIRVLCPGAVFRCDDDATHSPMFHQIEGLWVDRQVRMSDLKGTLEFFAKELFGSSTQIRLRPSYFPFVEPGAEVDVSCPFCKKNPKGGCKVCKGSGWLEILGAGMVHPKLFQMAGYEATEISGFAFGLGIERIAMLMYGIPDLRLMFRGDMRFLKQFA